MAKRERRCGNCRFLRNRADFGCHGYGNCGWYAERKDRVNIPKWMTDEDDPRPIVGLYMENCPAHRFSTYHPKCHDRG